MPIQPIKTKRAFTLAELIIVVVIVSVLATLALISYDKVLEDQLWMKARNDLIAMHAAHQIYILKHGIAPNVNLNLKAGDEGINTTFGLKIIPDGFEYLYIFGLQQFYAARLYRGSTTNNYYLRVITTQSIDTSFNPRCIDGTTGTRPKCPRYSPLF